MQPNYILQFTYSHYSFEYDNELASRLMQKQNLPSEYANTLLNGIWDNCEILPEEETRLQGVPIDFNN